MAFRKQKFTLSPKTSIFLPQNFAQSKIILTFALLIPRRGSLLCWGGIGRHTIYRRLSTLCSDVMKSRKFQKQIRNLATLDVLRVYYINTLCEVQLMLYLHFGYIIYRRGLRVVVLSERQCEGLSSWNDNSRIPRFFMSICEI